MFNKSDNGDLFTGAMVEVTKVGEESQLGLAIDPNVVHKQNTSDCVPSVQFLSGNGVSNSLGLLLRPEAKLASSGWLICSQPDNEHQINRSPLHTC